MAQETKKKSSTPALLAAFAVLLITILAFGWNVLVSAGLAAATFFVVVQMGGKKAADAAEPTRTTSTPEVVPSESQEAEAAPEAPAPVAKPEEAPVVAVADTMAGQVKLGTLLPGERELADRRGGWRYEG